MLAGLEIQWKSFWNNMGNLWIIINIFSSFYSHQDIVRILKENADSFNIDLTVFGSYQSNAGLTLTQKMED